MSGQGYNQRGYDDTISNVPTQYQNYVRSPPRRPVAPYARHPAGSQVQPSPQYDNGSYEAYRSQEPPSRSPPRVNDYQDRPYNGTTSYDTQPSPGHTSSDPFSDPQLANGTRYDHRPPVAGQSSAYQSTSQYRPSRTPDYGGAEVGYGLGRDQLMPGGRLPYRGDGYDEFMDPNLIADDGDEGYDEPRRRPRSKFGVGAGTGAATGGAAGAHVLKALGPRDPSGNYGRVGASHATEKSEWMKGQSSGRKKLKWIVGILIAVLVVGAVAGGVAAYFLTRKSSSGEQRGSASDGNGLWDLQSSQVQAVLNNNNLHKVFPGMDYTPLNAQYPACLANPPYQNDVTLDVAVLAQLTPAIRLYGTDCKQTEMVLKGIDLLGYNDTVKVWLGVYLDNNSTTNQRQLSQMYDILDAYPESHFAGVIVGNEVLFRKDLTITQLADQLTQVRESLSAKGISLPVSTADLGDDWTAALAADSDIVMSNVHPFFAGVTPEEAPAWTMNFWTETDIPLKTSSAGSWPANIISETGWPTQGGNDCGTGKKCPNKTSGSIAGIDELNQYMDGWVCQRLAQKTTYFWFEAFDEPWKVIFNDPNTGDYWEPHWGLMDVNRNLKSGVKIPNCNGQTVDTPY